MDIADRLTTPGSVNIVLLRGLSFPPNPFLKTFLHGEEGISITTAPAKHLNLKPVVLSSVDVPGYATIHPLDYFKLTLFLYENLKEDACFLWDFPISLYQKDPEALLEIFTKTVDILRGKRATALFLIGGERIPKDVLLDMLRYVDNVLELRRHESRVGGTVRGVYSLYVSKHTDTELVSNEYVLLIRENGIKIIEPPGKKEYEPKWKVSLPPLPTSLLKAALEHGMVPARYKLEMVKRGLGRMLAFMGDGILWTTGSEIGLEVISRSCKKVGEIDGAELAKLVKITKPTVSNALKLCAYAGKVLGLKIKLEGNKILSTYCPYVTLVEEAGNELCCFICEEYRRGVVESLSPRLSYTMTRSMARGHEFCEGVVRKTKGKSQPK